MPKGPALQQPQPGDMVELHRPDSRHGWRDAKVRAMGGVVGLVLRVNEGGMQVLVSSGPYAGSKIPWPTYDCEVVCRGGV